MIFISVQATPCHARVDTTAYFLISCNAETIIIVTSYHWNSLTTPTDKGTTVTEVVIPLQPGQATTKPLAVRGSQDVCARMKEEGNSQKYTTGWIQVKFLVCAIICHFKRLCASITMQSPPHCAVQKSRTTTQCFIFCFQGARRSWNF